MKDWMKKVMGRDIFIFGNYFPPTKIDAKNKKFAKELLFVAWTDLVSSCILYEKNLYAQSIYFLQQSIEKTTKVEYMRDGSFDIPDLMEIGHKSYLAWEKKDYEKIFTGFAKIGKIGKEKARMLIEERATYLKSDSSKKYFDLISLLPYSLLKRYLKLNKGMTRLEKITLVGTRFFSDRRISKKGKLISIRPELYTLSKIVSSHNIFTRYPNDKISPSEYRLDKGIIKLFPKIVREIIILLTILDGEFLIKTSKNYRNLFDKYLSK